MKREVFSKFTQRALRVPDFHQTVQDIKARNAGTDPRELQALIDKTVREVRVERRAKGKTGKA